MSKNATYLDGTVKRIVRDKFFGFIAAPDGQEYFFHRSSVLDFETLREGDEVRFLPSAGPKGPRAENVERL